MKHYIYLFILLAACTAKINTEQPPWEKYGPLTVQSDCRIISHKDGTPFLWLGCTAWGMTEWLNREDVELYLDDRKSKGMNVVQLCLFWGKRTDNPTTFYINPENAYGHRAFVEKDGFPDVLQPAVVEGGSTENPNDYWDHVDFCLQAIEERGMFAAVLPFWGRRYVNASHSGHSTTVFTLENIKQYGEFLANRYSHFKNIIWVSGGDVRPDAGGDFLPHYRLLAEGLVKGATGKDVKCNEPSALWDRLFITYHPDGSPMHNSSTWFHNDAWLDVNMIETHKTRDKVAAAIRQDLRLTPLKPTILAEGHYEGKTNNATAQAIHVRRQAYQSFFTGAAGFTYGGGYDEQGNGPLFGPSNNWKPLLNWPGAGQMLHLLNFLQKYNWSVWQPALDLIINENGTGELEKVAVEAKNVVMIYFPDTSKCTVALPRIKKAVWLNPENAKTQKADVAVRTFTPPTDWQDAVLILHK